MSKRKYYKILIKDRRSDPEGELPWYEPVEASWVGKEFTRGYIACSQGYYPSPDIKIVNAETDEVIEEIKGNGEVYVN